MVLRIKNFSIFGVHWKILLLGGVTKNQYTEGLPKKGGLGQFVDSRMGGGGGGLARKREWCFWGRVDTPMPTIYSKTFQASKMDRSAIIVNSFWPLIFFVKCSILDIWQGSRYAYVIYTHNHKKHLLRNKEKLSKL